MVEFLVGFASGFGRSFALCTTLLVSMLTSQEVVVCGHNVVRLKNRGGLGKAGTHRDHSWEWYIYLPIHGMVVDVYVFFSCR